MRGSAHAGPGRWGDACAGAQAARHRGAPRDGHAGGGADALLLERRLGEQPDRICVCVAAGQQADRGSDREHLCSARRRRGPFDLLPGHREQLRRRIHRSRSAEWLLQGDFLRRRGSRQLHDSILQRPGFAQRSEQGLGHVRERDLGDQRRDARRRRDHGTGVECRHARRGRGNRRVRRNRRQPRRLRGNQCRRRIHDLGSAERHLQHLVQRQLRTRLELDRLLRRQALARRSEPRHRHGRKRHLRDRRGNANRPDRRKGDQCRG